MVTWIRDILHYGRFYSHSPCHRNCDGFTQSYQGKTGALNYERKIYLLNILKYASLSIGAIVIFVTVVILLFPDPFVNAFLKDRISKTFSESYPGDSLQIGNLHYSVWKNTLDCDSLTMKSPEYDCRSGLISISGINWMRVLWQRGFTVNNTINLRLDVQNATITFRLSQNQIHLEKLHVSVPDSELVVDSIKYYSLVDEENFFAKSKYRQTRFRADISHINITGMDCLQMIQGNIYSARGISLHEVFTDILVNMDKPYDNNSSNPQMPNEFLSSIKETIKIDSLKIINGYLKYSERYVANEKPGYISFNKVNVSVRNIVNHTIKPNTVTIIGEGLFMNCGKMKLFMEMPINEKDFSLIYSGSLSSMEANKLNSFIEPGEHHRIKSGNIKSAEFNINVRQGNSNGNLYLAYGDLSIALLNKKTGSENGFFDRISSIIGKMFIIRGSNKPDKNGKMKIGMTKYNRNPDDYFFQFIWFGLRNGIADVVGFPQI